MSGNFSVTLGAALTVVLAFGTGCSHDNARQLDSVQTSGPPITSVASAAPPSTPLPPPEALTDVLSHLADPAVPGSNKLSLVQGSTPETAAALDRFTTAARDGGYLPMTFTVNNVAWSAIDPSDVMATVIVRTANPDRREFTFPMQFAPYLGGWQLSHKTAEMLLALQNARSSQSPTPPAPPSPAPAPSVEAGTTPSPSPTP